MYHDDSENVSQSSREAELLSSLKGDLSEIDKRILDFFLDETGRAKACPVFEILSSVVLSLAGAYANASPDKKEALASASLSMICGILQRTEGLLPELVGTAISDLEEISVIKEAKECFGFLMTIKENPFIVYDKEAADTPFGSRFVAEIGPNATREAIFAKVAETVGIYYSSNTVVRFPFDSEPFFEVDEEARKLGEEDLLSQADIIIFDKK